MVLSLTPKILRPKRRRGIVEDCVSSNEIHNGRNTTYEEAMINTIREAKVKADVVIMCLHSGGQFNSKVGPYTQHLFDIIADAGADAIICNHAHRILPIFRKDNCLIASALGNFSFAPEEGYWVDGVHADYSALLHITIKYKSIIQADLEYCKCIKNERELGVTIPINDLTGECLANEIVD